VVQSDNAAGPCGRPAGRARSSLDGASRAAHPRGVPGRGRASHGRRGHLPVPCLFVTENHDCNVQGRTAMILPPAAKVDCFAESAEEEVDWNGM
jgi:hypothetical protein